MYLKHVLIVSAIAACMSFAPRADAASWYSAPIDHIELTSTGDIIVFLKGTANHECGSKRVDYAVPNDAAGKAILAALLSWQAQDKNVNVYISSCSGTAGVFTTVVDN
jgi:hypothetical protein